MKTPYNTHEDNFFTVCSAYTRSVRGNNTSAEEEIIFKKKHAVLLFQLINYSTWYKAITRIQVKERFDWKVTSETS